MTIRLTLDLRDQGVLAASTLCGVTVACGDGRCNESPSCSSGVSAEGLYRACQWLSYTHFHWQWQCFPDRRCKLLVRNVVSRVGESDPRRDLALTVTVPMALAPICRVVVPCESDLLLQARCCSTT